MAKTKSKSVKKVIKKVIKKPVKKAKKIVKKVVKKSVKKIVKKPEQKAVKKAAKKSVKAVKKTVAKSAPKAAATLMGVMEMRPGETKLVIEAVKEAIVRNTEEHPFYDSTDDKSTVIVSKEVEFVDTKKGVYTIPKATTISVIRDGAGVWMIERHTD